MMAGNKPGTHLAEINVTPLVDVMLVLLIIFMVSAPMMKEGMKVDLPEVEAKAMETRSNDLIITIHKDLSLDMNGAPTTLERLSFVIDQVREERNVESVYIQGDEGVSYGYVVQVMGMIRSGGISNIGLVTQAPEPK
jgi:biopolymer transport protein TolR